VETDGEGAGAGPAAAQHGGGCLARFGAFLADWEGERVPIKLFACITAAAAHQQRTPRPETKQTNLEES
jgi:hypothetical protein